MMCQPSFLFELKHKLDLTKYVVSNPLSDSRSCRIWRHFREPATAAPSTDGSSKQKPCLFRVSSPSRCV